MKGGSEIKNLFFGISMIFFFCSGFLYEAAASHLSIISYDFDGGGTSDAWAEYQWSPYKLNFDPRHSGFNFLGKFKNETISLFVMDALEGHGSVGTLSFDFITFGDWADNNIFTISDRGQYVGPNGDYIEPIVA
jgi:hypothetical protein